MKALKLSNGGFFDIDIKSYADIQRMCGSSLDIQEYTAFTKRGIGVLSSNSTNISLKVIKSDKSTDFICGDIFFVGQKGADDSYVLSELTSEQRDFIISTLIKDGDTYKVLEE